MFEGAGEIWRLCREKDWRHSALGHVESWPESLRTTAELVLACSFPMVVLWGPDLVQIYNDGYAPILGAKHPWGLGIPTKECWPEAWDFNEPIYRRVFAGETVSFEDQLYRLLRRGPDQPADDVYITLSYSPVRSASGEIGGVLVTLLETTARVTSRRLEAERESMYRELEFERSRLGYVFERSPSFLAVLHGPDYVVGMANDAYLTLLGRLAPESASHFLVTPRTSQRRQARGAQDSP